ncbi:hypothetical protein GGH96_000228 [Coemansia sp. RSA 1972]|nr:hypothetical protein GGH96_000228 [Coemansia sp. RSA 1972]
MYFVKALCLIALLGWAAASGASKRCPGYIATRITETDNGFTALLKLNGQPCSKYGRDIASLTLSVRFDTSNRLHVHISDTAQTQYQIPSWIVPLDKGLGVDKRHRSIEFSHTHDKTNGFGFRVERDGEAIFDTTGHVLVFEDQYLELTSNVASNANIYGLGESPNWFRRNPDNTTVTLWNRDAADPFGENVYGSHAVYMELRSESAKFHGCYLHNSHGMDVVLDPGTVQYRVLGGTLDLYIFSGPTALDVIDQYTQLVGRPARIPYWALGFHNCRYGYTSVDEVNQVITNYSRAQIPLEAAWTDIEYMDKTRDFTFDAVNYPVSEMKKQLDALHSRGQKMVLITDPAIHVDDAYGTFVRGRDQDVFIKNADGTLYVGQVWPGYTVFPDWFAANTSEWWSDELHRYFDTLDIDGMWIDMNEPASFCTGSCGSNRPMREIPERLSNAPHRFINTTNRMLVPPYAIHNPEPELSDKTVETTAMHATGVSEYHVHNLYGHMESRATRDFLLAYRRNQRPFILSRSTFAGSGALVSHWTGDNTASWTDLHISIASVFDFGVFGIPMVGADICGFYGNTTEELCARWMELGAFYPFSRSHNAKGFAPQEPYRWASVAKATRRALRVRYALLAYMYSTYQDSVERGWPVARPLVYEFPNSQFASNDRQMLIGSSILVSPVLTQGARSVNAMFPTGRWYNWYTNAHIDGYNTNVTLDAPLEHINVHIRGGSIVPTQRPEMTTTQVRQNDYELVVATSANGTAVGQLYVDDGESFDTRHRWIDFSYDNHVLYVAPRSGSMHVERAVTSLVLLGVVGAHTVSVNGARVDCSVSVTPNSVVVTGLNIDLNTSSRTVVS